MSTLQLLIVCATVLTGIGLIVLLLLLKHAVGTISTPDAVTGPFAGLAAGQRIAAHIDGGQIVTGMVVGVDASGCVTLAGASIVQAGGAETPVPGAACRLTHAVLVQELTPPPVEA